MKRIPRLLLTTLVLFTIFTKVSAQQNKNEQQREQLNLEKDSIISVERAQLKLKVEKINRLLRKKEVSEAVADSLKADAALVHATKINNQTALLDQKIAAIDVMLMRMEEAPESQNKGDKSIRNQFEFAIKKRKHEEEKDRIRYSSSDLVLAIGLNNTLSKQNSIEDSPYQYLESRFFELGWAWTSKIFLKSDFFRFKYGLSIQYNGLKPTGNRLFVNEGSEVKLLAFESSLKKSKLAMTNLVAPIHFEFGNKRKHEEKSVDSKRGFSSYSHTHRASVIIGFGGYAGFNIKSFQKLKYSSGGEKEKRTNDLNINKLIYGVSVYIAFSEIAVYAKYDLMPIFKDQTSPQQNVSLGFRFDIQ